MLRWRRTKKGWKFSWDEEEQEERKNIKLRWRRTRRKEEHLVKMKKNEKKGRTLS